MSAEIEDDNKKLEISRGGWKSVVKDEKKYDNVEIQTELLSYEFKCSGINNVRNMCFDTYTQTDTLSCSKYTSVYHDKITQTSYLPNLQDKLMTPSSASSHWTYGDSFRFKLNELFLPQKFSRLEEESARKIQRFFRACRTKLEISSLARFSVLTRTQPPIKENLVKLNDDRSFKIIEYDNVNAKRRSDFEMVEHVLDRWRILENERIDRMFFGSSRIAAKCMIVLREIELLRSIELAKLTIQKEKRQRKLLDYLDKLAQPEKWITSDGKIVEVETLRVTKAQECRTLFYTLMEEKNHTKRIDVLKNIIKYINDHTCEAAKHLKYLANQEIEFMNKQFNIAMLIQLKNRTNMAFYQFILKFCEYQRQQLLKQINIFCNRCEKLLPIEAFSDENYKNNIRSCKNCAALKISKNPRILYEPYEQMLKDLRKNEMQMGCNNGPAFSITPHMIHYLVNYIWRGKSGISEFDDLFQLRLLRFRLNIEWSPWNCIVLTKREAAIHQAMTDPWELYEQSLVKRFLLRNLQAKLYFTSSL